MATSCYPPQALQRNIGYIYFLINCKTQNIKTVCTELVYKTSIFSKEINKGIKLDKNDNDDDTINV